MKKYLVVLAAMAFVMAMAGSVLATAPGDTPAHEVTVNASVQVVCNNWAGGPLNLDIDPSTSGPVYSTGTDVTVQCTKSTPFNVSALSAEAGGSASTSGTLSGKLKSTITNNDIPYTLYFTPTFTGLGFTGSGSTIVTAAGGATAGANVTASAAAVAQAGIYSDTVTLTITY